MVDWTTDSIIPPPHHPERDFIPLSCQHITQLPSGREFSLCSYGCRPQPMHQGEDSAVMFWWYLELPLLASREEGIQLSCPGDTWDCLFLYPEERIQPCHGPGDTWDYLFLHPGRQDEQLTLLLLSASALQVAICGDWFFLHQGRQEMETDALTATL